jgi:hypothetical protein
MVKKDDIISSFAVILLLFTALIDWTVYSWLILVAIIMILTGWYLRKD